MGAFVLHLWVLIPNKGLIMAKVDGALNGQLVPYDKPLGSVTPYGGGFRLRNRATKFIGR